MFFLQKQIFVCVCAHRVSYIHQLLKKMEYFKKNIKLDKNKGRTTWADEERGRTSSVYRKYTAAFAVEVSGLEGR